MFPDKIKIQVDHNTQTIHLGLKVSDNLVHNLVMNKLDAIKIFSPATIRHEWDMRSTYCQYYKKSKYIKLFYKANSVDYHFRFTYKEWDIAAKKLVSLLKNS